MWALRRTSERWARAAVLVLSLLGFGVLGVSSLSGCNSCQRNEQQPVKAIVQRVQLPAAALAEITVPEPSRLWTAMRELTGGRFIAANLEMQLAESLGLSPLAAGAFVIQSPIRGVLLQDEASPSPSLVWAVRLKSGAELETLLTKGSQAVFTSQRLPSGETLLIAKQPPAEHQLAVVGNALLVAPNRELLLLASRYLTQSFPQVSSAAKPAPYLEVTLDQRGLQRLSEPLRQAWQAQRASLALLLDQQTAAQGRPADYADPASVLRLLGQQVQETLDLVGGLSGVRIRLNQRQDHWILEMTLDAPANSAAQKWFAGFTPGQLPPWAQLSNRSRLLVSHALSAEPELGKSVARHFADLFAERLTPADLLRIEKAFTVLGNGLGTSCTWGWLEEGEGGALFLVSRVRDATSFKQGLKGMFELHTVPALRKIASELLDGAQLAPVELEIGGDAVEGYQWPRASVSGAASAGSGSTGSAPARPGVLWAVHGELGYVVWGPDSVAALRELLMPTQTLADQAELQSILGRGHTVRNMALLSYGNSPGVGGVVAFGSIAANQSGAELRLQVNRAMIQSALPWGALMLMSP
jgi:hypothetical protein